MSVKKLVFNSAAQFNEYAKKEIIKDRALALLSRNPAERLKHERKANGLAAAVRLFGEPIERRLMTSDNVAKAGCTGSKPKPESKSKPASGK